MKPILCAVIDDEPIARQILEDYIKTDQRLQLSGSYRNARQALSGFSMSPVELIFLDINMPELSGFQMLRAMAHTPGIVFTTAYREYAVEGFDANAIDYLLKPIGIERFLLAVNKCWQLLRPSTVEQPENETGSESFFFVKSEGKLVKIHFADILYVEALKEYIRIVTAEKSVITYHTLSGLEEKLPAGVFYRIHRSFLANGKAVESVEGLTAIIGKNKIPISRNERNNFIKFLADGKLITKK